MTPLLRSAPTKQPGRCKRLLQSWQRKPAKGCGIRSSWPDSWILCRAGRNCSSSQKKLKRTGAPGYSKRSPARVRWNGAGHRPARRAQTGQGGAVQATPEQSFLLFTAQDMRLCVRLEHCIKILPLMALQALPGAPPHLVGLMNLHGEGVQVVDIAACLDLKRC